MALLGLWFAQLLKGVLYIVENKICILMGVVMQVYNFNIGTGEGVKQRIAGSSQA